MAKNNTSKKNELSTPVKKAAVAAEAPRHEKSFNPKALYAVLIVLVLLTAAGMLIDYYTAWGNTPKLIKRMLESAEKNAIYKHYSEAESKYEAIISRFGNKEVYKEDVKQARLSLAKTYKDAEQYLKAIDLYKELAVDYK